jgi:hypothetical protein
MNISNVYQAPKSSETFIKTEYCPATQGVATEIQCDNISQVKTLLFQTQKATLAMGYFSCIKLLSLTLTAIYQHIKQRLLMIFNQSV